MKPLSRGELLNLPPASTLPDLGRALGISEPVVRDRARRGDFAELGIRIVRLGAQWRVVTADIWRFLGVSPDMDNARPTGPGAAAADSLPAKEQVHVHHNAGG
jgi:hypothetical protein